MKIIEKMKCFYLKKMDNGGFTLVELIVVIAILAILAGVAVPAYSGYVEKANKQADMQLVSDVEKALELAYYDGTFADNESGYIVVSQNGIQNNIVPDSNIDKALKATFGDSYTDKLKLQYDGWKIDTAILNAAKHDYADAINNSSYITNIGTDKLLGDVQTCTTKLAELMSRLGGDWAGDAGAEALNNLVGGDDIVKNLLAAGGYSGDKITTDVLANATVFGVAGSIDNVEREAITNRFNGGYYLLRNHPSFSISDAYPPMTTDDIVDVAHTYAALEALTSYVNDPTITSYFSAIDMNGSASSILNSISTAGKNIVDYAMSNQDSAAAKKICEYYGCQNLGEITSNTSTSSPAVQDGKAYTAIMQTVNDLRQDYVSDLGASELFTNGDISNRVNNFVTAASLNSTLGADEYNMLCSLAANTEGAAVVISFVNDGSVMNCSVIPILADPHATK